MQLVLGDYIKKNDGMSMRLVEANEIINWFNNHTLALHNLYAEQRTLRDTARQAKSLIRPIITWWTSHVMSVRRLLELEKPFKTIIVKNKDVLATAAGNRRDAIQKAYQIIKTIKNEGFWRDLEQ